MADVASRVLLGSGLTIQSQSLIYVKALIQVGDKPDFPTIGQHIFGWHVSFLVTISINGRPSHTVSINSKAVFRSPWKYDYGNVLQHYQECDKIEELGPGNVQKEVSSSFDQAIKKAIWEIITHFAAVLITNPFHMITEVQFIGRELKYCRLCDSIASFCQGDGILGFFVVLCLSSKVTSFLCGSVTHWPTSSISMHRTVGFPPRMK